MTNSIVVGSTAPTNAETNGILTSITSLTSGDAALVFAAVVANGGGVLADNGGSVETVALT